MDASSSVPQPPDDPAAQLDPDLRDLLNIASSFTHALSESGAFDDLTERQAEGVESAMQLITPGDPASRRIAYLQLLDLLLVEPVRFRDALTALHDQLAAAPLPAPATPVAPVAPQLDTLFVSPGVVRDLHQFVAAPVTRWIDGTLYIGMTADHFHRVTLIEYDGPHECA